MRTTKVVLIFFICGLAAGACFGGLLSIPGLLTFWFYKGDKFLIPTYRYYLGIGLFLLLGLALAYSVSRLRGWVAGPATKSFLKEGSAAVLVAMSGFLMFALVNAAWNSSSDPVTWYLLGTVGFVVIIAAACWAVTSKLYYPGTLALLLTIPAAFCLLYLAGKVLKIPGEWSEMVTHPLYDSLAAAACGFWIARTMSPPRLMTDLN